MDLFRIIHGRGIPPASRTLGFGGLKLLALVGLCAAYLQGGLSKAFDFQGAVGEMQHFGLVPAAPIAAAVIALELGASALVLTGRHRWLGALALAAFTLAATFVAARYWELPAGHERFVTANTFYEHLGLVGGFVFVAADDLARRRAWRVA